MATTIKLKNGSGAPLTGDLVQGEPALDLTNKRLYTEDSGGSVIEVGTNPTSLTTGTFTSTGIDDNATSTAVTIDASNNVGIGTTTPNNAYALDVVGSIRATSSAGSTIIANRTSNPGSFELQHSGTQTAQFSAVSGGGVATYVGSTPIEAMRVDASGRVGISTATFDNAAQVLVAKGDSSVSTSDANASGFNFTAVPDTTTGKVGIGLKTYNETASAVAALYATPVSQYRNSLTARYNADSGGGYFSIEQLVPETASVQERMRIDASGNVGIGTSSPSTFGKVRIDVAGTTTPTNATNVGPSSINLYAPTNGGSTNCTVGIFGWQAGQPGIGSGIGFSRENSGDWGSQIRFYTHPIDTSNISDLTERMRIDASGNVGIGTTVSSAGAFTVDGTANANNTIRAYGVNGDIHSTRVHLGIANYYSTETSQILLEAGYGDVGTHRGHFIRETGTTDSSMYFVRLDRDNTTETNVMRLDDNVTIYGSLSKASGSFRIDHPLPEMNESHYLVHSFVESPQADNIYRGKVDLVAGQASVNIDTVTGMTEGTFVLLNRDIQCFTSNETGWGAVRGSVSGSVLTIEAQNNTSTDTVSWLVIGERQDRHMYDTSWTDEEGKVIVEPTKQSLENQ
jgi:hypothetical protein